MKIYYFLFILVCCFFLANGKNRKTFDNINYPEDSIKKQSEHLEWEKISKENAVIPGDFADPSIIRVGDTYYATGTSSEWGPHFPIFESKDLANWQQIGYVFNQTPSWAASSFWAPELFYYNETFYVYYVAKKKSDKISCIGVATSKDPAKGFTDKGIVLPFGSEAIDPYIVNDKGVLYMTWKAYGLDKRPIEILGCKLSQDGLKPDGTPFTMMKDDLRKGLEGQCVVKKDDYYYLFYSVGDCCGLKCTYEVCVARSKSLVGKFLKFENNPVLSESDQWKCPGHGTVVETKEGRYFYLYHAYNKLDNVFTGRQGMLAEVRWDTTTGWPKINNNSEAEDKNTTQRFTLFDDFSVSKLSLQWQWDFRHTKPLWQIKGGSLYLSGKTDTANKTGTALTVRPLRGDYEVTTSVINKNASLKGLVVYGDADQSVGIGIRDNFIEVFEVKNNKRTILSSEEKTKKGEVYLKIGVEEDKYRFFWSQQKNKWNEIKAGEGSYYIGDFLPPWDRSPRPGLLQYGEMKEQAGFSFFKIEYR